MAKKHKRSRAKTPPIANTKLAAGYRHIDKDPIIDHLMSAFRDSALSYEGWAWAAGLSPTTVRNWDSGAVRSPQYRSVMRAALAVGIEFATYHRGEVDATHRNPSTSYYDVEIRRWQRDHKERQPDAQPGKAKPAATKSATKREKETVS